MISSGCLGQQVTPEVICNSWFIRLGISCCPDQNSNNVCDNDETPPPEHFPESLTRTITPTSSEKECYYYDPRRVFNFTQDMLELLREEARNRGEELIPWLKDDYDGITICDNYESSIKWIDNQFGENLEKIACGSLTLGIAHSTGNYVLIYSPDRPIVSWHAEYKGPYYVLFNPSSDIPIPIIPIFFNGEDDMTILENDEYFKHLGITITKHEKLFHVEKEKSCEEYSMDITDAATSVMSSKISAEVANMI
ncbi:MAG: hypothetical protein ACXACY_26470 [Candidatus Hodarchaeales archaeon]